MISEEGGWKDTAFSKAHSRPNGSGRYQHRELFDTARNESEDLWEFSAYQGEMHPNSRVKGTIAELISVPYQIAAQNLPNQTFRDGYIPHSFEGVESFYDNQGEDDQRMRPDLTPLQFAGMVQPASILPSNPRYDSKQEDPHNIMVLRQKLKTGYALPPKAAVKYMDEATSRTTIDTIKGARSAAGRNKGITLTAMEEYQETMKEAIKPSMASRLSSGMSVNQVIQDLSTVTGAFSADTWGGALKSLGGALFNQINPSSSFAQYANNYKREYGIPDSIWGEVLRFFSSRAGSDEKAQQPK